MKRTIQILQRKCLQKKGTENGREKKQQKWKLYSNLRTNPAVLQKTNKQKTHLFLVSMKILKFWHRAHPCRLLAKREKKNLFQASAFLFLHFYGKLLQGASQNASENQCVLKATSLVADESVTRDFLQLFFNRDLEKPNDWETAWFILCTCWSVYSTVTYWIL